MSDAETQLDPHLVQLILSMQAGAMQQMGKIASPLTGKVERDLEMAKFSIDILGMIETKTKGNLSEEEEKFLTRVLYELRMNYVDETKKGNPPDDDTETAPESPDEAEKEPPADSQSE